MISIKIFGRCEAKRKLAAATKKDNVGDDDNDDERAENVRVVRVIRRGE